LALSCCSCASGDLGRFFALSSWLSRSEFLTNLPTLLVLNFSGSEKESICGARVESVVNDTAFFAEEISRLHRLAKLKGPNMEVIPDDSIHDGQHGHSFSIFLSAPGS
jgi:hypothetical protein